MARQCQTMQHKLSMGILYEISDSLPNYINQAVIESYFYTQIGYN